MFASVHASETFQVWSGQDDIRFRVSGEQIPPNRKPPSSSGSGNQSPSTSFGFSGDTLNIIITVIAVVAAVIFVFIAFGAREKKRALRNLVKVMSYGCQLHWI
jgi:hypothetical protein